MDAVAFPEIFQRTVARLVEYCHERVGVIRRGFDFGALYRELREHAGASAGPGVADIAFLQFLRDKVREVKARVMSKFLLWGQL